MIRYELIAPVGELLRRHAAERPEKTAFEDSHGASITYAELYKKSAALAVALQSSGVDTDDRIAILLPNSVDWVLSCMAITRADGVSVPISHDAVESEIRYRLEDAACKAIIVSTHHLPLVERLAKEIKTLKLLIVAGENIPHGCLSLATLSNADISAIPRDSSDIQRLAYLVYTSGTTGRAKGVMLSQHSMLWVTAACWVPIAGLCESDVVLSALPLFHSYALNLSVLSIVAVGATEFLMDKFSTQEVNRQLQSGRFTLMPGVPTMFHYLLESNRASDARDVPGVRYFLSAGAILPAGLNRDFEAQFGRPLLDGYGITETSTMVTMNWPGSARIMGSCGLPLPGLATRIIDLNGQDVAFGDEGELIVRGPNVMLGYLNKPEETTAALKNGWYHTGDLARSDSNGFLTITGRLKELIIRGGQNIAPAEVEDAVLRHPDVLDCAAIGMPHPHLGEVPIVCVIAREGKTLDLESIKIHCATLMSAYKVPHSVYVVASIPRTGSGKIMRFQLRAALSQKTPL
jgi:acyl-CoA synthetase (AMP-forming)/AMP-acid ligase II